MLCVARMGVRPLGPTINMGELLIWSSAREAGGSQTAGSPSSEPVNQTIGITPKKSHIRDILGRANFFCHTYDTCMMIIVTKPGIIIDVVGSYFYDKKS